MTTGAFLFLAASWALVLGLLGWSVRRILRAQGGRGEEQPGAEVGAQRSASLRK